MLGEVQRMGFESIGLLEDTELLFKFEQVWVKYKAYRQKKREMKQKGKGKKPKGRRPRRRRRR